jgi:hypothetical protein
MSATPTPQRVDWVGHGHPDFPGNVGFLDLETATDWYEHHSGLGLPVWVEQRTTSFELVAGLDSSGE